MYIGPDKEFFIGMMSFVLVVSIAHLVFIHRSLYFWCELGIFLATVVTYCLTALKDPGIPS